MSRLERRTIKTITTPQTTAKLNISPDDLAKLPPGAKFESKQGNATATAKVAPDGTIEITANCDSLSLLIENLEIEVYRLQKQNTALVTNNSTKKSVELSGWQHFQIKGFWVCIAIIAIFLTYKKVKRQWQTKN